MTLSGAFQRLLPHADTFAMPATLSGAMKRLIGFQTLVLVSQCAFIRYAALVPQCDYWLSLLRFQASCTESVALLLFELNGLSLGWVRWRKANMLVSRA